MIANDFSQRPALAGASCWVRLVVCAALLNGAGPAHAAETRPNIVFILADDLGYGALGCYGQKKVLTPHLDRMAAEGMRFTQCYSGCTVCAPSRSVLMTGLHGGHTRFRTNQPAEYLHPTDVTVAELLKAAHYATGVFGKWGVGDIDTPGAPDKKGFDEFFGYLDNIHAHYYYPEYLWDGRKKLELAENRGGKRGTYSQDLIEQRAHDFVRRHRAGPFFLYLTYTIPHAELLVPEDSLSLYRGRFPETPFVDTHFASQPTPHAAYAGMIDHLDRSVGRLLALLGALGITNDTIVFFSSDNGPTPAGGSDTAFFNNSGPLRGQKFDMYEGGIRVPMIVRWPGKIAAGQVNDYAWAFHDFMPTACALAGIEPTAGIDGISVLPTLRGQPQPRHDPFYWEMTSARGPILAARMGRWKAVCPSPGARLELYDLENDSGETTDLADQKRDVLEKLKAFMKTARTEPSD